MIIWLHFGLTFIVYMHELRGDLSSGLVSASYFYTLIFIGFFCYEIIRGEVPVWSYMQC